MGSVSGEEVPQRPIAGEDKIYVSVRLRPLNEKEFARNEASEWECINENTIIYRSNLSSSERCMYPTAYTFDRIFSYDCSTRQVYIDGAKEVALSVVSGINSSIFAYGQTSSGKTYTMSGITLYTVEDIYDYIEKHKEREFVLKFSAMEIYNESVRDLLSSDATPLRLLDDPERGTVVERLTEEILRDWNHFRELLYVCETQRQIGETSLNETSSRSHQILRLTIESSAREFLGNDKSSSLAATVNFVDLAGSERASQTLSAGTRLKEGCHINRSLLTLGTVIRKLSKGRNGHVPFRDSKLTRILQSSIGGNARTAIICTISPTRTHVEQSRNTLLFATCAKEVATNARVNVVMSDKALVKQLQRELSRLEDELRISMTANTAELLREKDLQIEKLEKKVTELTFRLDLAQSQIKEMLRVVGDDVPATELGIMDHLYPKLRVRNDFENQTEAFHVRSFDPSHYSDGHSSSDHSLLQSPDIDHNFIRLNYSPQISVSDIDAVESDVHEERNGDHNDEIEEQNHDNVDNPEDADDRSVHEDRNGEHNDEIEEDLEEQDDRSVDICKDVRCIESEDLSADKYTGSNMLELSPNRYTDSNMSSPDAKTGTSVVTMIENREKENRGSALSMSVGDKQSNSSLEVCIFPSPEKKSSTHMENDCSGGLMLIRSRSCNASLMMDPSSLWFDKAERMENTPPIGVERVYSGRPESSFERKLPVLKYSADSGELSRSDSQNSVQSFTVDEPHLQNFETSIKNECGSEYDGTLVASVKEKEDLQRGNQLRDQQVTDITVSKSVKDVGLDPVQSDTEVETPLKWNLEFPRLQREIIELWHVCNISLLHRTYFFLLFKGDPADSIYMEVELRRLSFLKKTFSQGSPALDDDWSLGPASSLRNLRRERQMLSKQMQKRLSKAERENLYKEWGIGLNTRHRRLKLAHRLWTDTKDMNHIRESALIVAKLMGSVEQPDPAFKAMFGLNFAPRCTSRKSFRWTGSVKHLL